MEEFIDVELENKAIAYSKPIFTGKDILDILIDKKLIKENSNYNKKSFYPSGKKDLNSIKYSIIDGLKFLLFFDLNKAGLSKTNTMKILNYFKKYQPKSEKAKSIEYISLGCLFEEIIDHSTIENLDTNKGKFFFAIDSEFHPHIISEYPMHLHFFKDALEKPFILIPFYSHFQVISAQIAFLIMTFKFQDFHKYFSKDFLHIVINDYK